MSGSCLLTCVDNSTQLVASINMLRYNKDGGVHMTPGDPPVRSKATCRTKRKTILVPLNQIKM